MPLARTGFVEKFLQHLSIFPWPVYELLIRRKIFRLFSTMNARIEQLVRQFLIFDIC